MRAWRPRHPWPESVGRRLTGAFGVLLVLILAVAVTGFVGLVATARASAQYDRLEGAVDANRAALQAMTDAETGVRGYRLAQRTEFLDPYWDGTDRFSGHIASLRQLAEDVAVEPLVARQVRAAAAWQDAVGRPVSRMQSGKAALPHARVVAGKQAFDEFRDANASAGRALDRARDDQGRHRAMLQWLVVAALAASLLSALAIASWTAVQTRRGLVHPLGQLRATVIRLASGERHARAVASSGPVEVRDVAHAVNALADESVRLHEERADRERMRVLAVEVGRRVRQSLELEDVLEEAVRAVGTELGCDRVFVRLLEGDRMGPVAAEWYAHDLTALADAPSLLGLGPYHAARDLLEAGRSWVCDDVLDSRLLQNPDGLRYLVITEARSVLVTPIVAGGKCLATLTLAHVREPHRWTALETEAVEDIAADLARALVHAHVYAQQSELVEQLRALDRTKTDFLSTVSHELRTPLTSISGYIELVRDQDAGPVTPEMDAMLAVVDRNTWRLKGLIEDLLTLSRIESGSFRMVSADVDVPDLLRTVTATVTPSAASSGIELECAPGPAGLTVHGDAGQLERMVLNLLTNAVKFTRTGGRVAVAARVEDDEVVVEVNDTGIGIPQAEQVQLFSRFFRATNAAHHAIQGTGLGLTIVRSIVEHHGGLVTLRSREGVGTTVTVRLPLRSGGMAGREPALAGDVSSSGTLS